MVIKKRAGKAAAARPARKTASQPEVKPSAAADLKPAPALAPETSAPPRKASKISTVSHTLDTAVAERLRHFAFHERVSESAVLEYALREFFKSGEDAALGLRLRDAGAALRRRT